MKLKKLLPLAGMTGVAAIAAPLVTSCAQKGTEVVWTRGDTPPSVGEPTETTFNSAKEATQAYFGAIDKDKTLLSKDIILSNLDYLTDELFESITKTSVRTDKVDKDELKVSYVNKIEGNMYISSYGTDTVKGIAEYEAKNVEFCIDKGVVISTEDYPILTDYNYFQPKLAQKVRYVYYLLNNPVIEPTPQEISDAAQDLMDYAQALSKDNSWYFYYSEDTEVLKTTQRIDASNVYEYAYQAVYEYNMTLTGFLNLSTYFENVEWGGE